MNKFICQIEVVDPDTREPVPLEVWKCGKSGGMYAIDATFLDQVGEHFNPFTGEMQELPEPDEILECFNSPDWCKKNIPECHIHNPEKG